MRSVSVGKMANNPLLDISLGDLRDDVRLQHIRLMLDRIVEGKRDQQDSTAHVEKYLKRLSICVAVLLTIQFVCNMAQTTVYANVDKRIIGALSLFSSATTFVLTCLSKHASTQVGLLHTSKEKQRQWDKAEDTFIMELVYSLEDDQLTANEYGKLKNIYTDVNDFMDGTSDAADQKKISS